LAQRLAEVDGYADWREQEASDLRALVKKRLDHIQNPLDCSKAKKIVCKLDQVRNLLDIP
jgi:glycoprotein 6-alpha-L-fucosyltransferase